MPFFKITATTQFFINSCIHGKAATLHMRTDAERVHLVAVSVQSEDKATI